MLVSNKGNVKDLDNFKEELKLMFETSRERKFIVPSDRLAQKKVMLSQLRIIKSKKDMMNERFYMFGKIKRDFTPAIYTREWLSWTYTRSKGRKIPSDKIMQELYDKLRFKNQN